MIRINVVVVFLNLLLALVFPSIIYASSFSYDIGIAKECILVPNSRVFVPGRVINTGQTTIELTLSWGAIWGIPGPVSIYNWGPSDNDQDFNNQFGGVFLEPGESFDFTWFNFVVPNVTSGISNYEGSKFGGSFGITLPEGDMWIHAGYNENVIEGVWKWGYNQVPFEFVYGRIDDSWVHSASPVPVPGTILLLGSGSFCIIGIRKIFRKEGNTFIK